METESIVSKAAYYVKGLFQTYQQPFLLYHNIDHTESVVEHTVEIAAQYNLAIHDMNVLQVAAWFHDTGHLFADLSIHEEKSVALMRDFMEMHAFDEAFINEIAGCILATRMPHEPKGLLQEIICDADTYHFGTQAFKRTNQIIHKEYKLRQLPIKTIDWERNTVEMLERHHFFTPYCQVKLADGKQRNLDRARKKLRHTAQEVTIMPKREQSLSPAEKQTNSLVNRGIQTMLRITSENHLELSSMADGKANILISVNAIIISVILSILVRKLEVEPYLTIPTLLFLGFSVSTIVIAILATRPKITEGTFSREDVLSKQTNLLFFGNFHRSTLEDYEWAMGVLMKDKEYLYNSLVRDIYYLGVILGRKYRLIRLAYTVFMIGIVVSVVAFLVASLMADSRQVTTITMPQDGPL